jgi:hypothetical protein
MRSKRKSVIVGISYIDISITAHDYFMGLLKNNHQRIRAIKLDIGGFAIIPPPGFP